MCTRAKGRSSSKPGPLHKADSDMRREVPHVKRPTAAGQRRFGTSVPVKALPASQAIRACDARRKVAGHGVRATPHDRQKVTANAPDWN